MSCGGDSRCSTSQSSFLQTDINNHGDRTLLKTDAPAPQTFPDSQRASLRRARERASLEGSLARCGHAHVPVAEVGGAPGENWKVRGFIWNTIIDFRLFIDL